MREQKQRKQRDGGSGGRGHSRGVICPPMFRCASCKKEGTDGSVMKATCFAPLTYAVLALNLYTRFREYLHFLVFVSECQRLRTWGETTEIAKED